MDTWSKYSLLQDDPRANKLLYHTPKESLSNHVEGDQDPQLTAPPYQNSQLEARTNYQPSVPRLWLKTLSLWALHSLPLLCVRVRVSVHVRVHMRVRVYVLGFSPIGE